MPSDVADFHGRLSFETRLSAVLERIFERSQEGLGILRLTDEVSNRTGEIALSRCKYVCGAVLREKSTGLSLNSGYEALRLICGIASAEYVYLAQGHNFEGDLTLNIDLQSMIKLLPHLPEDRTQLQNDEFMLNRIFATTTTRERIPAMSPPNAATWSPSSGDGWKAAAKMPVAPWADGSDQDGVANEVYDRESPRQSLQERAQQEIGDVTEPRVPQPSVAQKLLETPVYFALNVVTATAQVTKVTAIIAVILFVIGGAIYCGQQAFQFKPPLAQQHVGAPAVKQPQISVRHSTKVFAVRRPSTAPSQNLQSHVQGSGVMSGAEPGSVNNDGLLHRRAYQTYR